MKTGIHMIVNNITFQKNNEPKFTQHESDMKTRLCIPADLKLMPMHVARNKSGATVAQQAVENTKNRTK